MMLVRHSIQTLCLVIAALSVAAAAEAQAPSYVPFQGYLTDTDGVPIEGDVEIRFRLYDTASPTGAQDEILHEETQTVSLEEGYFTAYLGDEVPLALGLFRDNAIIFVGLRIGDDADEIQPLAQLATAPYAAFAQYCADADTLGGVPASQYATRDNIAWSSITGVPADIADGDANTQLTESQVDAFVANNGYLTSVAWSSISGIPADIADGDANTQLTESQVDAFVANNGYLTGSSRTRYFSIPGLAFNDHDRSTYLVQRTNYGTIYFGSTAPASTTAYLSAPVTVPHGSRITAVHCEGRRSSDADSMVMRLWRSSGSGTATSLGAVTAALGDAVNMDLTLSENVSLLNNSYYIEVVMTTAVAGDSGARLLLHDCRVTYTQTDL